MWNENNKIPIINNELNTTLNQFFKCSIFIFYLDL